MSVLCRAYVRVRLSERQLKHLREHKIDAFTGGESDVKALRCQGCGETWMPQVDQNLKFRFGQFSCPKGCYKGQPRRAHRTDHGLQRKSRHT
jgi:hypothetical protein